MSPKKFHLIIVCSLLLISCRKEEHKTIPTREPLPHEVLEELTLKEMQKGRTVWILNAGKALNYEEERIIKIYDIHLEFYDADGTISSILTADSGAVFTWNKDMCAISNVKVVTRKNEVLETDLLEWSNEKRLISTESRIRITTKESMITGVGLESDPELKHIKVKREFHAYKIEKPDSLN